MAEETNDTRMYTIFAATLLVVLLTFGMLSTLGVFR